MTRRRRFGLAGDVFAGKAQHFCERCFGLRRHLA